MFHVKRSELPPHGGRVRGAFTNSADLHPSAPLIHDDPSIDPINQCDDGREHGRRQSWAEKAILFYQYGLSPLKPGPSCRFEPTCSNYALTAIRRYGVVRGVLMAAIRLSKCGPWHPGGWDPVPPRRTPRERVHDAHVHDDKDHREGTADSADGQNDCQRLGMERNHGNVHGTVTAPQSQNVND